MADTFKFQADASDYEEAQKVIERFFRQFNVEAGKMRAISQQLNAQNKLLEGTFKGVGSAGENLTVKIERIGSSFQVVKSRIGETATGLDDYTKRVEKTLALDNEHQRILNDVTKAYERETEATNKATAAEKKRQDVLKEKSSVKAFLDQLKGFEEANKKLFSGLQRTQAVTTGEQILGILGGVPGKAGPSQIDAIRSSLGSLIDLVRRGKIESQQLLDIFTRVKAGQVTGFLGIDATAAQRASELLRVFREIENSGERFGISIAGIVRLFEVIAIKRVFGALQNTFEEAIRSSLNLSVRIGEIQTITQSANLSSDQWANTIRKLSDEFGRPQAEIAEGIYQAISNQVIKAGESTQFMTTALEFARVTTASTADSVNLLSSVINAYNLSAQDAERISATLFKTIELGRLRASDIANTFGRTTVIASQMKVPLEEVSAALATLTRKGVLPADALTLINNILVKLLNPTAQLKKFLEELGVSSGQAAIQAFGFAGVLRKISQAVDDGRENVGELVQDMRAIKGVLGLTGDAFEGFENDLKKVTEGQNEYKNAVETTAVTTGQRFKVQIEQVKNLGIEYGKTLTENLIPFIEGVGGVAKNLERGIEIAKAAAIGYIAYKTAIVGATLVQKFFTVEVVKTTTATGVLTTSLTGARAAAIALQGVLATGLGLGAIVGIGFVIEQIIFAEQKAREEREKTFQRIKETNEKILADDKRISQDRIREYQKATRQIFQAIAQFAADTRAKIFQELEGMRVGFEKNLESLKVGLDGIVRGIEDNIRKITEARKDAENAIKSGDKAILNFRERLGEQLFEARLRSIEGDPVEQVRLLNQRNAELFNQVRQFLSKKDVSIGGPEALLSLEQANKRYEQVLANLFKILDLNLRYGSSQGIIKQTTDAIYDTQRLYEESIKRMQGIQEENVKKLKEQEELEKQRLTRVKDLIKELLDFKIFDEKTGKVLEQFKGPEGLDKARTEFERLRKELIETLTPEEVTRSLDVFNTLLKRREDLFNEHNKRIQLLQAEADSRQLAADEKRINEQKVNAEKERQVELSRLLQLAQLAQQRLELLPSKLPTLTPLKDELREALQVFSGTQTSENLERVKAALQAIQDFADKTTSGRRLGDLFGITDTLNQLTTIVGTLRGAFFEFEQANQKLRDANTLLETLQQRALTLPQQYQNIALGIQNSFNNTNATLDVTLAKIDAIIERLQRLNSIPAVNPNFVGPPVPGFQHGGLITGPRGRDNLLIRATAGEFVTNAESTKRFYSQLLLMNRNPKGFAEGGMVTNNNTTNLGDINLSLSPGTTQAQARQIVNIINREIRRGTVRR